MGLMIRQNKNIKGIKIEKETICSLQYADGSTLSRWLGEKFKNCSWLTLLILKEITIKA